MNGFFAVQLEKHNDGVKHPEFSVKHDLWVWAGSKHSVPTAEDWRPSKDMLRPHNSVVDRLVTDNWTELKELVDW